MPERWATFDVYGTLIDWMGGIRAGLARIWPDEDADRLLERYHELEPQVEEGRAIPYREVLAETLDEANGKILENNRSPARKVGELDNRGSHYYLALYWAQALARRDNSTALSARFKPLAAALEANEAKINAELIAAQGKPVDTGGYYLPEQSKTSAAMRPSKTLNEALAKL